MIAMCIYVGQNKAANQPLKRRQGQHHSREMQHMFLHVSQRPGRRAASQARVGPCRGRSEPAWERERPRPLAWKETPPALVRRYHEPSFLPAAVFSWPRKPSLSRPTGYGGCPPETYGFTLPCARPLTRVLSDPFSAKSSCDGSNLILPRSPPITLVEVSCTPQIPTPQGWEVPGSLPYRNVAGLLKPLGRIIPQRHVP